MPKILESEKADKPIRKKITTVTEVSSEAEPEEEQAKERPSFWDYMWSLTKDQWTQHIVYLYRLTDQATRAIRGERYIQKYTTPFTVDDIKREHGGGDFKAMMSHGRTLLYNERFSVEGDPKFSNEEKIRIQADQSGLTSVIERMFERFAEERNRGVDPKAAMDASMSMMTDAYQKSLATIAAQNPAATAAPGPWDKVLENALPLLLERAFRQEDPTKQLTSLLALLEKVRGDSGAMADLPVTGNWKVALAQSAGPRLDSLFEKIQNTVESWTRGMEARTAAMLASQGYRVHIRPESERPATTAAEASTAPFGPKPTTATGTATTTPQIAMQDFVKSKLIEMLHLGKNGDEAAVVADNLHPEFAAFLAKTLKENPQALATDNILAAAVRYPNCQKFCEDYVDYFEEEWIHESEPVASDS